jgi:hypothetical protein
MKALANMPVETVITAKLWRWMMLEQKILPNLIEPVKYCAELDSDLTFQPR